MRLPTLPPSAGMLDSADAAGITVRQALELAGLDPSPASLRSAAVPREQVLFEQGCPGPGGAAMFVRCGYPGHRMVYLT